MPSTITKKTSDAKLVDLIEKYDVRVKTHHGKLHVTKAQIEGNTPNGKMLRSSAITAQKVGCSPARVEQVRVILDWGGLDVRKGLKLGKMTIMEAYRLSLLARDRQISTSQEESPSTLYTILLNIIEAGKHETTGWIPINQVERHFLSYLASELQNQGHLSSDQRTYLETMLFPMRSKIFGGLYNARQGKTL